MTTAVAFATATEGFVGVDPSPPGFKEVVERQKDREEREVGVRHDAYIRVSASSMATTTPTAIEIPRRDSILEPTPNNPSHPALPLEHDQFRLEIPSENQNRTVHLPPPYTNGISTTPSSSILPSTPMPVPISIRADLSSSSSLLPVTAAPIT